MDTKQVLKKVIKSLASYQEKQKSFKKIFVNEPVMSKAIEVFDSEMDEMIESVLELIGVPEDQNPNDKYDSENWTRDVCADLIKSAAKNEKYIEPAAELISDWENLSDYVSRVESTTWFHYNQLLDDHITGYKNWHEKQLKNEKDKGKGKNKTA